MRLHIISDLHIENAFDPMFEWVMGFLDTVPQHGDSVVLCGDIFDFFVTNKKYFLKEYSRLINLLESLPLRSIHVYFIEGNHDFLLDHVFKKVCLKKKELFLELEGKKFYFVHGDMVNKKEWGYLCLRRLLRSSLIAWFVKSAPDRLMAHIGNWIASKNKKKRPSFFAEHRNIYRSFAALKIQEGMDFVVMGHTHDLDEMIFSLDGRMAQYINMGYPKYHKSCLVWESGDVKISRQKLV